MYLVMVWGRWSVVYGEPDVFILRVAMELNLSIYLQVFLSLQSVGLGNFSWVLLLFESLFMVYFARNDWNGRIAGAVMDVLQSI
jgi:hypothetical protein